jgi:hypothetical protein
MSAQRGDVHDGARSARGIERIVTRIILEGDACVQYQAGAALRLINSIRKDVDAQPWELSNPLCWTCQEYCNVLQDLEDSDSFYRIAPHSGFQGNVAVMNAIALSFEGALELWLRSTQHRKVLLGEAQGLGFGRAGIVYALAVGLKSD